MITKGYRWLLKLPRFKGRDRLIGVYRHVFLRPGRFPLIHGLRFEPDPLEWTQTELLRDGYTEPLTSRLYAQVLRPGDTYVDVGTHVGFHTLLARHYLGAKGRVIAIEPQPYNCNKILANWRSNNFENIFVHIAAAGDREGTITLQAQAVTDTARLSLAGAGVSDEKLTFEVPIRRLEKLLADHRIERVRLLKIDVEGYELAVLRGLGAAFGKIDNIIVELLDAGPAQSDSTTQVLDLLRANGFQLRTVTGASWEPARELPENNLLAARR